MRVRAILTIQQQIKRFICFYELELNYSLSGKPMGFGTRCFLPANNIQLFSGCQSEKKEKDYFFFPSFILFKHRELEVSGKK